MAMSLFAELKRRNVFRVGIAYAERKRSQWNPGKCQLAELWQNKVAENYAPALRPGKRT